jgi:hypothetical protein
MLGMDISIESRAIWNAKAAGREEGALTIVTHLLICRFGQDIPKETIHHLTQLPLRGLIDLSEALLDFSSVADLQTWLSGHPLD